MSETRPTVWMWARANVRELLFVAGLLLMATGLALVYLPAALIVPGAILIWLAIPPGQTESLGPK